MQLTPAFSTDAELTFESAETMSGGAVEIVYDLA
jgi:hypothetical protein